LKSNSKEILNFSTRILSKEDKQKMYVMTNKKISFNLSITLIFGLISIIVFGGANSSQAQRRHGHDKVKVVRNVNRNTKVVYSRSKRVIIRPRVVRTVKVLPVGYRAFVHNRNNYYTHGGLYYSLRNNVYVATPPPFGIRISILPTGYRSLRWRNANYFYHQGSYYNKVDATNEYEVIEPQIGMVVPELPEENVEEVTINDQVYYEFDDYLYKQIPTKKGLKYEVVGKLSDVEN
jgi:Family of unknown function (DUF6515)